MGTSLFGTTPQDTYDSLIKVTDNGPLSGTLKALSDGLGNDSTLSLSTAAASIAGTLAVAGAATFDTSTLVVDATNNRVGVGTATPASTLDVAGTLRVSSATPTEEFYNTTNGDVWASIFSQASGTGSGASLVFSTKRDGNSATDKMTITQAGNVGIGTSAPEALLHVNKSTAGGEGGYIYLDNPAASTLSSNVGIKFGTSGGASFSTVYTGLIQNIVTDGSTGASDLVFGTFDGATSGERMRILAGGGITFNGDTLQVNALDDYEEGTFTPTVDYSTSGTPTYAVQNGVYTKIGRSVQVQIVLSWNENGAVGDITIQGLPFTSVNTYRSIPSILSFGLTGLPTAISVTGIVFGNSTSISLFLNDNAATTLTDAYTDNDQDLYVTVTYQAA